MTDHVLPLPQPDWNNPVFGDASTPEEVDARAKLAAFAKGLPRWLTLAAMYSLPPRNWREMAALLNTLQETCIALDTDTVAEYIPARILIHSHPFIPGDETYCDRCGLPPADQAHHRSHHRGPRG